MSQGLLVTNINNQIILSDYTKNFHFLGIASYSSNSGVLLTDIPYYSGAYDALDGMTIYYYSISSYTDPLVFIKPSDYSRFYGLVRKYNVGNTWYFEVMVTGTSLATQPALYCFTEVDGIPTTSNETHGLTVYKTDGVTRTFDSRYLPLAIYSGGSCIPPEDPTDGVGFPTSSSGYPWNYATNDHDFRSTTRYNAYGVSTEVGYTDLMFAAPAITQATWFREMNGYKKSCGCSWTKCCQEHTSHAKWWVMYRNLYRIRSGYFDSGWGPYSAGYAFKSWAESGGWLGGDSKSYSTGDSPYAQKTINYFSQFYLIADSRPYS